MRKISASFFTDEDFVAVDKEIEALREQDKAETQSVQERVSADVLLKKPSLHIVSNGQPSKLSALPQTAELDETKTSKSGASGENDNSFLTESGIEWDQEENANTPPENMDWLFGKNSQNRPVLKHDSYSDRDEAKDLATKTYQITMGLFSAAFACAYFLHVAEWMGAAAAGLAYAAFLPKSKASDILVELGMLCLLLCAIYDMDSIKLLIAAAIITWIVRIATRRLNAQN